MRIYSREYNSMEVVEQCIQELKKNGITHPEDIEGCLSATGIEISIISEDDTCHEGYYDSIDEAIEALNKLRKLYPQLSNK